MFFANPFYAIDLYVYHATWVCTGMLLKPKKNLRQF